MKGSQTILDGVNLKIETGKISLLRLLNRLDEPTGGEIFPHSRPTVGIVTLPEMMTGQILAGSSPPTAVRYQIVIVFMQAATVAVTTAVVTLWYRKTFFTSTLQFLPNKKIKPKNSAHSKCHHLDGTH